MCPSCHAVHNTADLTGTGTTTNPYACRCGQAFTPPIVAGVAVKGEK